MKYIGSLLVILALFVAGCGGPSEEEQKAAQEKKEAEQEKQEAAAEAAEQAEIFAKCEDDVGDLLDLTEELNSRLLVGLTPLEYEREVEEIVVTYDQIDIDGMDDQCVLRVGVHVETATRLYLKANNLWSDCLSCAGLESELQDYWDKADAAIEKAENGLSDLEEGGSVSSTDLPSDAITS